MGINKWVGDGRMTRMNLTVRTIASTFFVILFSLVGLFAQAPTQPRRAEFVKQGQLPIRERNRPGATGLRRQILQTSQKSFDARFAQGSVLDLMGDRRESGDYFAKSIEIAYSPQDNATAKTAVAITSAGAPSSAKGEAPEVRVAVVVLPPLVMEQNGSLSGFSIELWEAIAKRLKVETTYQVLADGSALENAMRSKTADLTPTVFITSARDAEFEFSYPILDAGLRIMVRDNGATVETVTPLRDMLGLLFSRTTLEWFGVALLLALIPAHLVWLLERRHPNSLVSNRNYFPGIFEASFWGLSTLTLQAEGMPRQWAARALSILWMFVGVVFVASYTARLTSTLTVERIRGSIEGPDDLPGKPVATIAASLAVDYLRERKAQVKECTPDEMFKALLDKRVDAVVAPSPLLAYYAAHEGKGRVRLVGPVFNSTPVAIELQLGSPLRRKIDGALIALRENGTYKQIYNKWFGTP
jgi:polar amino acid transport system substrate-binding protein